MFVGGETGTKEQVMYEDVLRRVEIFNSLDKKELETLGRECRERSYSAGTTLIRQGDSGSGLFIITSGHVQVTIAHHPDRAEEVAGTFGPGSVLGEMALLDDQPRSASIVATEDVKVLILPVWEFRATMRSHPDIAIKLLSVLSKRLRKLERKDD
jgi:CRP/FNR family transcriptional regulator, cyclic AMP receptor protein